jgi:TfoX/Sxy family transcriptional regulator of competence genes
MATDQSTIEYLLKQVSDAATARKMFGEYALYMGNKVIGFVCDNQLFIKPSDASASFQDRCSWAPAYPGSKDYLMVPEEDWSDRKWLITIFEQTASALPEPKAKKKKA